MWLKIPTFADTGYHIGRDTKNPCNTVSHVVTQVMEARYEARHESDLVNQMAGDMSFQKLSDLKTNSTLRICFVC